MKFPKEFHFKRVYDNCERELEIQLLGWSARGVEQVHSPWNLTNLVKNHIAELGIKEDLSCERPQSGSPETVLAMKRLAPYYGSLYVKVRNMWALHYRSEA